MKINKINKINILSIISLVVIILMTSCLKDKYTDFSQVGLVVELPDATPGAPTVFVSPIPYSQTDTVIVRINEAAPNPLGSDLVVTLAIDPSLIDAYNKTLDTTVTPKPVLASLLPDSTYKANNFKTTIKANMNVGYLPIFIDATKINGTKNYVLPLRISNASGQKISGNFNVILLNIKVQNIYDGVYTNTGYTLRAGDAARTGSFKPYEVPLVTSGKQSVTFGVPQNWANNGGISIGNPILAVDPVTNNVTISSATNATVTNNPSYVSKYDPVNKVFYISFTWSAGPAARLATDTLTYLRPR